MSEKQRGEVNITYPKGCFREFSGYEPIQFYQIYEREIHANKSPETPVFKDGVLLIYCVAGGAKLRVKSTAQSIVLREHTVVMCSANESYVFEPGDKQKGVRYICLNLQITKKNYPIPALSELCSYFCSVSLPVVIDQATDVGVILSGMISELCGTKKTVNSLIRGKLYQILVLCYRYYHRDQMPSSEQEMTVHAVGHTAYAIIRYVDEHLYAMNNLADMAKELGYSYNYLSHLFRRKTGMTIQTYVSRKKIEKSLELLVDGTLSITEIATLLNYDCIQSFSKAFKRMMQMSPTQYRLENGVVTELIPADGDKKDPV